MTNASAVARAPAAPAVIEQSTELNIVRPHALPLALDQGAMDSMVRLAEIMATGKATVPQEYRNNPGDCLAVVMQAVQWRMNPYAVAQKTHFVSGKIGYEAQLVNAVIISLAPTEDRIHYEWYGPWEKVIGKFIIKTSDKGEYRVPGWKLADEEGIGVRVWATIKGEEKPRELPLLLAQARTRNSTLWADDPRQQLAYLAVKRWARLYTPDVIMGVYSPDELEEISQPTERNMGNVEVVREKLSTPPVLSAVLAMIAKAVTREDMEAARVQAEKLVNDDERKRAGNAWRDRLAEAKAAAGKKAATGVNQETGEIIEGDATQQGPDAEAGASAQQTSAETQQSGASPQQTGDSPKKLEGEDLEAAITLETGRLAYFTDIDKLAEATDALPMEIKSDPRFTTAYAKRLKAIKGGK